MVSLSWIVGYKKEYLSGDLSAGVIVGIMLIPQGMAYAMIAGLPAVYGLYASIFPQLVYAILGTSRKLSVGPVAMDSMLVAAGVGVMSVEGTEAYIAYAIMLAFFMGIFQVILGFARMGFVTNLLSQPVIKGFTSAAAFIIGLNQIKHLFGISLEKTNQTHLLVAQVFSKLGEIHWLTFAMGVLAIVMIKFVSQRDKRIPGPLIAVALGSLLVYLFNWQSEGVGILGSVPEGLPGFQIPHISLESFQKLFPLALTIALVAFMESYSVAKALESSGQDEKVHPNRELIALGASNLVGSFFLSFPVSGGFSRSAINEQAGAKTPLASIVSALLVAVTLVFLTPLFYYLPTTILAAVIMVAVTGLVDLKYAIRLVRTDRVEFALLITTFLFTLVFGMVVGIAGGVVASILVLLYRAAYPHIARLGRVKNHHEFRNVLRFKNLEVWDELILLRVDAPLEFINIQYFKDKITSEIAHSKIPIEAVVIDAGPVSFLDATAADGIKELVDALKDQNIRMVWCDLIGPVRDTMRKTGLFEVIGRENVFMDLNEAVNGILKNRKGRYGTYAPQSDGES